MQARNPIDAHRLISTDFDLQSVLARRYERKLTKDLTFSFERQIYRVLTTERRIVFPHALIEAVMTSNGEFFAERNGRRLPIETVRDRPQLAHIVDAKQLANRPSPTPQKPAKDHPWRHRGGFQLQALGSPKGDISNLQTGDIPSLR